MNLRRIDITKFTDIDIKTAIDGNKVLDINTLVYWYDGSEIKQGRITRFAMTNKDMLAQVMITASREVHTEYVLIGILENLPGELFREC